MLLLHDSDETRTQYWHSFLPLYGMIFIRVSWRETISKQDEIIIADSTGSSVDDGIAVFNASF
jgi:hypothetical protein